MLKVSVTTQFKKEVENARKRGKDLSKLREIISKLSNEEPLEQKFRNHS